MERKTGLKRRGKIARINTKGGHPPSQRVNERILSAQNILGEGVGGVNIIVPI